MVPRLRTWLSSAAAVLESLLSPRHRKPHYGPFPLEIWFMVFEHMGSDVKTILASAAVCRAFNELSSIAYLTLENPRRSISAGTYTISADTLPVLQRSLYTPPIRTITCHFPSLEKREWHRHLQTLRSLATILRDATSIEELDLTFEDPFFPGNESEELPLSESGTAYLSIIRMIVHLLLVKYPEEPAFLLAHEIYYWSISPVLARRQAHSRRTRRSAIKDLGVILDRMRFPNLRNIRYQKLRSGCLCTTNTADRRVLSLETAHTPSIIPRLTAHQLVDVITANNFKLEALHELNIRTTAIDPTILSNFLTRHPKISSLTYDPVHGEHDVRTDLIDPPVQMGELFSISSDAYLPLLVRGIASSGPTRAGVRFYSRSDREGVGALKDALRVIAQHGTIRWLEIEMNIIDTYTYTDGEITEEIGAGRWDVVKTLHNVSIITLAPMHFGRAHDILPWLQLFPALQELIVRPLSSYQWPKPEKSVTDDLQRTFEEAARAAFPRLPHDHFIFETAET
ncbi:hypothetical protein B0H15DRAFT_949709 [Mycena belliarum]|uniref:F-box domain-containing protein n=1 Tax=Mycena belliarum TaxID=1033014 RepID=A0AAD6XUK5_9AGAR|nr:hypothetical protein B0H15DRAFT_949709 [Mycena belliae]